MLTDIINIIIKYLIPNHIGSFLLSHQINFDTKFSYDASYWPNSHEEFNNNFKMFTNIIITGIRINNELSIFDEIIVPIAYTKLKCIKIVSAGAKFIKLTHLQKCINLRILQIYGNIDGNIEIIYNLKKIRYLDIMSFYNRKFSIGHFSPNLRCIYIQCNRIIDPYNVKKFKKLRKIELHYPHYNYLSVLNQFNKLKTIKIITMIGNEMPDLSGCKMLKNVVIRCCRISVVDNLHKIRRLKHIKFVNCLHLSSILHLDKCENLISAQFDCCGEYAIQFNMIKPLNCDVR